MLRRMFQNFTANSSSQLGVDFHYIQNLHYLVTTLLKQHYFRLPGSCEKSQTYTCSEPYYGASD